MLEALLVYHPICVNTGAADAVNWCDGKQSAGQAKRQCVIGGGNHNTANTDEYGYGCRLCADALKQMIQFNAFR